VCACAGPQLTEILQAAHIQPYVDAKSNHVCNGLLLRADMHVLFDLGLITLTPDLRIRVSSKLQGRDAAIEILDGQMASIAMPAGIRPAASALECHMREVFEP